MASLPFSSARDAPHSPRGVAATLRGVLGWAVPRRGDWPLLALYALGFAVAHRIAAPWGGQGYYSLWFPAAGLRLALLWRAGARLAFPAAVIEFAVDMLSGAVALPDPHPLAMIFGVTRPAIAYGITVAAIRRIASGARAELLTAPMPLGLAVVLAPLVAALAALPQAIWMPQLTGVATIDDMLLSLTYFTVGDLLGTLLVTPPLLWVGELLAERRRPDLSRIRAAAVTEAAALLPLTLGAVVMLARVGLGLQPMPVLLAVVWIGLRFGRASAWIALALVVVLVLPQSAGAMPPALRLQLHLALATVVLAGYLAGSFADAQARARADLSRRDRLLFQAERLKTLRAMSVAVIHEISQPLSTLAIEARHLHSLARLGDVAERQEIEASAALIDRKAASLSELVRRLRRFGGRSADEPSSLPLMALLYTVADLAAAEAKAARVQLALLPCNPDLVVLAQEVELAQAVVNLVRNAVQACGDGVVQLSCTGTPDGAMAVITVANRCVAPASRAGGMGVGLLIARTIVEAHGGRLEHDEVGDLVRYRILLPLLATEA